MNNKRMVGFVGILYFIFLFMYIPPCSCQQPGSDSISEETLSNADKESIRDFLEDLKKKLEKDKSDYTFQSFLDEGNMIISYHPPETLCALYSIDVVEKAVQAPKRIHVHIPEITRLEYGQICTYITMALDYEHIRIFENWRLNVVKNGNTWQIRKKELIQMGSPQFKPFIKEKEIYRVRNFEYRHDCFTMKFEDALVAPIYADKARYGLTISGGGKVEFTPPDDIETYQLKRYYKKDKLRESVSKARITMNPGQFENFFKKLDLEPVEEWSNWYKLQDILEDRLSFYKETDTYIALPDRNGSLRIEFYTESENWMCYTCDPERIKEIALLNQIKYSISTYRGSEVWCEYHCEEDRKTKAALQMELENKTEIDLVKLTADVKIDKRTNMDATAVISYATLYDDITCTTFSIHEDLKIKSIIDHVDRPLLFSQDKSTVKVYFHEPLPRRKILDMTCTYAGEKFTVQVSQHTYYVGQSWYPEWRIFDSFYIDFTIRVPKPFIALSNGYAKKTWEDEGYNITNWTSACKIDFPVIIYGDYVIKEDKVGDKPVMLYVRTDSITHLKPVIEQAKESLKFFSEIYGEYPYEQLTLVESRAHGSGAQAPNSIIYIGSGQFSSWVDHSAFGQGTVAHEVSHQWFGHLLRPISWHEYWWVESLAQFSEGLFLMAADGNDLFKNEMFQWKLLGEDGDKAGPLRYGYRFGGDGARLIYYKGPYVFHMLRMMYGTEKMVQYLKNLVDAFQNKSGISTGILEMVAEKTFGQKLDWFFDQWVRKNGIPKLTWTYTVTPKEGKYSVLVTVNQKVYTGDDELKDTLFKLQVPLRIYYRDAEGTQINLNITQETNVFPLLVPEKPKKITMNEFGAVMCKVKKD